MDEMISNYFITKQFAPRPGLVFDRIKRRWVRPEESKAPLKAGSKFKSKKTGETLNVLGQSPKTKLWSVRRENGDIVHLSEIEIGDALASGIFVSE